MPSREKTPRQLGFKARKPQDPIRFKLAVAAAERTYRNTVEEIADRAWDEVIVPICREHKLDFMAGSNGTSFVCLFTGMHQNEKVEIGDSHDAETKHDGAFSFLVPVFQNVIDVELTYNDFLGYYIRDARFLP